MLKFIINRPLMSMVMFVLSFEMVFESHMLACLYVILLYVVLKATGLTKRIKRLAKVGYFKLLKKSKELLIFYTLKIYRLDLTHRNIDGTIDGIYMYYKGKKGYWVFVKKTNKEITMKIWDIKYIDLKTKPIVLKGKPFFINYENVTDYLNNVNF